MPLRGTTGREKFALPARYVEDAWNGVYSFGQALRHENGAAGMPSGPLDWVFFPDPLTCHDILHGWSTAQRIGHGFGAGEKLVELCPELEMTPSKIADRCREKDIWLVLDTEHLVRARRAHDPNRTNPHPFFPGFDLLDGVRPSRAAIERVVGQLASHVGVVHVKSVAPDSVDVLIVRALLEALDCPDQLDFVAEYNPKKGPKRILVDPWAARRYMADFMDSMRRLVENG